MHSPQSFQVVLVDHLEYIGVGHLLDNAVVEVSYPEDNIGLTKKKRIRETKTK